MAHQTPGSNSDTNAMISNLTTIIESAVADTNRLQLSANHTHSDYIMGRMRLLRTGYDLANNPLDPNKLEEYICDMSVTFEQLRLIMLLLRWRASLEELEEHQKEAYRMLRDLQAAREKLVYWRDIWRRARSGMGPAFKSVGMVRRNQRDWRFEKVRRWRCARRGE